MFLEGTGSLELIPRLNRQYPEIVVLRVLISEELYNLQKVREAGPTNM